MTPAALYSVEAEFEYRFTNFDGAHVEPDTDFLDDALNESTKQLYALGIRDVGMTVDHDRHRFWLTVAYLDEEERFVDEVFSKTWSSLRAAFHAAGIGTPGWPNSAEASVFVKLRSSNIVERDSADGPLVQA